MAVQAEEKKPQYASVAEEELALTVEIDAVERVLVLSLRNRTTRALKLTAESSLALHLESYASPLTMRDVRGDSRWSAEYDLGADALRLAPKADITLERDDEHRIRLADFDPGAQTLRAIFVAEFRGIDGLADLEGSDGSYRRLIACSVHWERGTPSLPLHASIDQPVLLMHHEGWTPTNELTLTLLNTADCNWLAYPTDSTPQNAGAPTSHEFPGGVAFQLDLPSSTLPGDEKEAAGSVIDEKMDVKILNGTGWEVIAPGSQQAVKRWTIRTKPSDKPVTVLGTQENAQLRISITGLRALSEGQTYLGVRCTQGGKFAPWSVKLPLLERKYYETPPGTILMWSGDPTQVPKGWQLCDGSKMANGKKAPDLRERFVCGAGPESPHMTGGDYTR